jgi:hypothetical protein
MKRIYVRVTEGLIFIRMIVAAWDKDSRATAACVGGYVAFAYFLSLRSNMNTNIVQMQFATFVYSETVQPEEWERIIDSITWNKD